jgi:membrane protein
MSTAWRLLKRSVLDFIQDEALTRGAAIAFYAATSIAPLLLIVISIAGMVFGREASQGAVVGQLSGIMGKQTAEFLQTTLASASDTDSGTLAAIIGVITLLATASGGFRRNTVGAQCHLEGRTKGHNGVAADPGESG